MSKLVGVLQIQNRLYIFLRNSCIDIWKIYYDERKFHNTYQNINGTSRQTIWHQNENKMHRYWASDTWKTSCILQYFHIQTCQSIWIKTHVIYFYFTPIEVQYLVHRLYINETVKNKYIFVQNCFSISFPSTVYCDFVLLFSKNKTDLS